MNESADDHAVEGNTGRGDGLARAAAGDMGAFASFYDDNAEAVLRFFQSRTACPETAADLTAETFAVALGSLGSFRPSQGSGSAWLFGIARNQLRRYWRWRRVDARARARLGMSSEIRLDDESYRRIEDLVDFVPVRERLREAVAGLSPHLEAAVRLRIVDGLSYTDIAERLGCTEAAARARVSRALRRLSAEMEEVVV